MNFGHSPQSLPTQQETPMRIRVQTAKSAWLSHPFWTIQTDQLRLRPAQLIPLSRLVHMHACLRGIPRVQIRREGVDRKSSMFSCQAVPCCTGSWEAKELKNWTACLFIICCTYVHEQSKLQSIAYLDNNSCSKKHHIIQISTLTYTY